MKRGNGEGGSGRIDPKQAFIAPLASADNSGAVVASVGAITVALFAGSGFFLLKKKKEL